MRKLVNKLSLNSGRSKCRILKEFSINDLNELLVYENIEYYSLSKNDVMFMSIMAAIASTGGGRHNPNSFMPEWAKGKSTEQTKEQICQNSKRYWGQWEMAQRTRNKNDKTKGKN